MEHLVTINKDLCDNVEIRNKIDLIIDTSFTRIQKITLRDFFLQNDKSVIISMNKIKNKKYQP